MKTRSISLLIAFMILIPAISSAQFGAVRRAINRQIDHKVDSSLEQKARENQNNQANDASSQNNADSGNSQQPRNKGVGLFGGKIDIKYKDNYDYTGRIYMVMETYDKKETTKSDFYTYFNESSKDAGIELQTVDPKDQKTVINTAFIVDYENRAFMSLFAADSKIGTISSLPTDSALAAQSRANSEKQKQPVVTKTGNSKVIAGYKCDEYKVVDPEKPGYSMVWMTKEFKMKSDTKYWGKSGMPNYYNYPGFEGMVMLAFDEYNKSNEMAARMETKEIDEHYKHSISTVGYTFTKVNFGQARSKK